MTPLHAAAGAVVVSAFIGGAWAGWDWRDARAERERVEAVEAAQRDAEALHVKLEESHAKALEALVKARNERDLAESAGRDLRVRLNAAVAAARAASAAGGEAAGDPIGVFADLLIRADERAGILADYADRARIAGLACERSYQALMPK